jgi:hypothetical protein
MLLGDLLKYIYLLAKEKTDAIVNLILIVS